MTPVSLAKAAVRWGAAAQLFLVVPPQIRLMLGTLRTFADGYNNSPQEAVVFLAAAGIAVVAPLALWIFAGRIARYLAPAGSDSTPAPDYEEWQQMGLTCVGIFMLLRVVLTVPDVISNLDRLELADMAELAFYLVAGLLLIFGWRVLLRPFRRA